MSLLPLNVIGGRIDIVVGLCVVPLQNVRGRGIDDFAAYAIFETSCVSVRFKLNPVERQLVLVYHLFHEVNTVTRSLQNSVTQVKLQLLEVVVILYKVLAVIFGLVEILIDIIVNIILLAFLRVNPGFYV